MFVLYFLLDGPDTILTWLFYILLGFMALVIFIGSLVNRGTGEPAQKSRAEAKGSSTKVKLQSKAKLHQGIKRSPSKKKSK